MFARAQYRVFRYHFNSVIHRELGKYLCKGHISSGRKLISLQKAIEPILNCDMFILSD
jgi:hypothetical protein